MGQPFQSLQSDNWVHISIKAGEKPLIDVRAENPDMLRQLVDGLIGEGALASYVQRFHGDILDGAVRQLQNAGVATTPVAPAADTPPFVPGGQVQPPPFVPPGTPQATFPPPPPATAGPKTLGKWGEFDVILWAEGKYGANVQLKGGKGADGKDLRANLAKGESPDSITLDRAIQLLEARRQYVASKA